VVKLLPIQALEARVRHRKPELPVHIASDDLELDEVLWIDAS